MQGVLRKKRAKEVRSHTSLKPTSRLAEAWSEPEKDRQEGGREGYEKWQPGESRTPAQGQAMFLPRKT